jgi:hypothetical protein
LLPLPLALTACAPVYDEVAFDVVLLAGFPLCEHARLGTIEASDGRTRTDRTVNQGGGGTVDVWSERADPAAVYADLRRQAAARGANAVVVRRRQFLGGDDAPSGMVRADTGLRVIGTAIRSAVDLGDASCGARRFDANG